VRGEGEQTMIELLRLEEAAIRALYRDLLSQPGSCSRAEEARHLRPCSTFIKDLDRLPFPAGRSFQIELHSLGR
jgi:hypothetical protein